MMKALFKKAYELFPFKKQFFSLVKIFWTPPEKIYKHLHFVGIINIPVDRTHSFRIKHHGYTVENDLFWSGINGEWEQYSLLVWRKLASRSNIIFDIGANTGVYSLLAKAVNKKSTVYAFEPVKRVYEKLVYNNELNGFDIRCVQKALSDKTGVALIYDNDSDHEYAASLNNKGQEGLTKATQVEIVTLDNFIETNNLPGIDLMKIDVEHHEPEVLNGFKTHIKNFRPSIIIEILTDRTGEEINQMVEGLGYNYFSINEKTGLKKVEQIKKGEGFNYLLCSDELSRELGILKG